MLVTKHLCIESLSGNKGLIDNKALLFVSDLQAFCLCVNSFLPMGAENCGITYPHVSVASSHTTTYKYKKTAFCLSFVFECSKDKADKMVSQGIQMLGMMMTVVGWLMVIVVCALPMWKVNAFIGANIITAQIIWQGIWMNCVVQSTGQMQCKIYDSILALPQDLQAARGMIVMSIVTGICGVVVSILGGKCTNCIENERAKAKACILAGVFFIISGLLCLIPVSWTAHTIITNFYNPLLNDTQRYEFGAALYIGWAAAALLLMGGGLLCWNCPPKNEQYVPKFTPVKSITTSREFV